VEALPAEVLNQLRGPCGMDEAQIAEMVRAVNDGVRCVGDYIGMGPEAANGLESTALAYYRHQRYDLAGPIYAFLVEVFPHRHSAWRGLGAVAHAQKNYLGAVVAYLMALKVTPDDLVSQVLLGEAYLLAGRRQHGVACLEYALTLKPNLAHEPAYLKRAKLLLEAQRRRPDAGEPMHPWVGRTLPEDGPSGATPAESALTSTTGAEPPAEPAEAKSVEADAEDVDPQQEHIAEKMRLVGHIEGAEAAVKLLSTPEMQAMVQTLTERASDGEIAIKDVAGMSDEQMQAGYVAACAYLEQGKPVEALQILGWLLFLNSQEPLYLQLAGVTAHHMKLHCLADYYYGLALVYDPKNPSTMIYRGEVKLLTEEREAGLDLLRQGIALGGQQTELAALVQRGQALLKQFATGPKQ
jgi:tetratricopeptide (TPR) repeat protein